jgi:hypothetical protein
LEREREESNLQDLEQVLKTRKNDERNLPREKKIYCYYFSREKNASSLLK